MGSCLIYKNPENPLFQPRDLSSISEPRFKVQAGKNERTEGASCLGVKSEFRMKLCWDPNFSLVNWGLTPPCCSLSYSQHPGTKGSQVCGGNLLRTGLLCPPDNPCVTTTSRLNKTEITPLIVLKRERETALIGQNSDLDGVEGKESVVREVVRGSSEGELGPRGTGFGSWYFLLFEDEQEPSLLCGCLYAGLSARDGKASHTGRVGGSVGLFPLQYHIPCGCHSGQLHPWAQGQPIVPGGSVSSHQMDDQ